jgi:hypothetical protein
MLRVKPTRIQASLNKPSDILFVRMSFPREVPERSSVSVVECACTFAVARVVCYVCVREMQTALQSTLR